MDNFGVRLQQERLRLNLNQEKFGEIAGVTKKTQYLYESDARIPDAKYLCAIDKYGVDIYYVLTGERKQPSNAVLTSEEQVMLDAYRKLPEARQKHLMVLALTGVDIEEDKKAKKTNAARIQIVGTGVHVGDIAGRDIVHSDLIKKK